ncbi:mevalonate kinase family protein [Motiliproteus sp.]|uniref:mevalonate kinase family protein n=1 Tax=Motiliproteus sp. TaxID=1898955 RepID=UPI003BA8A365
MYARAPSKAILSGEHAVVYGKPALALALCRYATAEIEAAPELGDDAELHLDTLDTRVRIRLDQLAPLRRQLQQYHQQFIAGERPIETVLAQPALLFQYALSLLPDCSSTLSGRRLTLRSQIPLGAGMGSSAATVTALLKAVCGYANKPLTTEELVALVTQCEQLQHGRSSGLDPAVCGRGGLLRFQQTEIEPLPAILGQGWYLFDSGKPECSTGQCGSQVRRHFGQSGIWDEFAAITEQFQQALLAANPEQIHTSIRQNQRLLERIGVVPDRVQRLVRDLEQQGASAKVSGAGAVSGSRAGLLLIYAPELAQGGLPGGSSSWQALKMDTMGAVYESDR